ncbi:MAG: GNAT family N-acetyltransferase [Roseiflexaceae bacterium]
MLHIRPFVACDADYNTLAAINSQAWPGEPVSKQGLQHDDQTWDQRYLLERLIVEHKRGPIAYAQYSETPWAYQPDKYFVKIVVLPDQQRQGVGALLYDRIFALLAQRGARLLTATAREDQQHAVGFLERRGFRQAIRELESRLDLAAFDPAPFQPALERVRQSGIAIASMREMQAADPDWLHKWWQLSELIVRDIPTSEAFTPVTLEAFAQELASPNQRLDAVFVAVDTSSGEWAGLSGLCVYPEDPTTLSVGTTGVLRSYRRRGIALALKVAAITWAQRHSALVILGENEEHNPMYLLNQTLGFRYTHAWLGFEKTINAL